MQNYIIGSLILLWLLMLTYLIFKMRKNYFNLVSKTGKNKIDDILDSLVEDGRKTGAEVVEIKKELHDTISKSNFFIKKIGVVRYNPFGRVGNDQSFVLSLLDNENNGVLINFIYTSDGLRVYTKRTNKGKGKDYQLSEEEEKAIKESS
ncbi:MAG: DUF4446 family protein [bacterium]